MKRKPVVWIGPLMFNVELARAQGWLEDEIQEVAAHLEYIGREHMERCAERYPGLYRIADGVPVFVGEIPK